jgi:hypothetical protein
MSEIVLAELSHKIAGLEVRERLAFGPEKIPSALRELAFSLAAAPSCEREEPAAEVVILSTPGPARAGCNRTEIYACAADRGAAMQVIRQALADHSGQPGADLTPYLYSYCGTEAVHHPWTGQGGLLTVAAGLDSLVMGENEILGQVRDACDQLHDVSATRVGAHRQPAAAAIVDVRHLDRVAGGEHGWHGAFAIRRIAWSSAVEDLAARTAQDLLALVRAALGRAIRLLDAIVQPYDHQHIIQAIQHRAQVGGRRGRGAVSCLHGFLSRTGRKGNSHRKSCY